MTVDAIRREFEFYRNNQDDIVEHYDGKVVVLKDHVVIGAYDSHLTAFTETVKDHEQGTFMIQQVSQGSEAYTAILSSPGVSPG